jgi:hypothetical protein
VVPTVGLVMSGSFMLGLGLCGSYRFSDYEGIIVNCTVGFKIGVPTVLSFNSRAQLLCISSMVVQ